MEVLKANRKREVRLAVFVEALPSCGYRVYYALPGAVSQEIDAPVQLLANGMENRHLRLEINADGSLNLSDKATGRHFHQLGYFSDDEDAGDEYDYSSVASLSAFHRWPDRPKSGSCTPGLYRPPTKFPWLSPSLSR